MPRYFFNLDDGQHIEDHSGNELPALEDAIMVAQLLVKKFSKTDMAAKTPSKWFIVVTDEQGKIVHNAYPEIH